MCAAPAAKIEALSPASMAISVRAAGAATKRSRRGPQSAALYVYRWDRCGRKGQRCRVTARGKMNSCRVEFADGFVMITSRNALAKAG